MDDDYRQAFYKQISKIDRVFDGDEISGEYGDTSDSNLVTLEDYDEHASLDEILCGM